MNSMKILNKGLPDDIVFHAGITLTSRLQLIKEITYHLIESPTMRMHKTSTLDKNKVEDEE